MPPDACHDCGSSDVRTYLDNVALCDRCADRRVAGSTGYPELPEPPAPITLTDLEGQGHTLRFRLWRAPTGVEAELEEVGVPVGEGYHLSVLGSHDADLDQLIDHLRRRAGEELGRRYLVPNHHREGRVLAEEHDEVVGRLVWSDEGSEVGTPYNVIVDGRTLTWEELGRALEGYEGWCIRLVIESSIDDLRPDAEVISLRPSPPNHVASVSPSDALSPDCPTIEELLAGFLADQQARLSPRTYANYDSVVDLLRSCLNSYGHQHLDPSDQARFHAAFETDEEAFVRVFGADELVAAIPEFLGYFMVRKVMAGAELLRSAGTVTKKLAKWLGERGYLAEAAVADVVERGSEAARDLPRAERLSGLLHDLARKSTVDIHALADDDYVEDHLFIDRVEPGALWFEGEVGPLKVPKAASDLAQPGWSVNVVLGRVRGTWHLVEVGNVYP
ncbi:MAG: DUF7686 domain-containing protein [Acidimicrobiales bacterium]